MKPVFLLTLCVSVTICTGLQAQTPLSPPPAPTRGTPLTYAESPSATPALPSYPAGTNASESPIGSPLEMEAGEPGRIWVETEYLLWWMKGAALPPLITASPSSTPATQAGVLGAPSTAI